MLTRAPCSWIFPLTIIIVFNIYSLHSKECYYPGHGSHSFTNMTQESVRPGTTVTYQCDNDYQLFGNSRRMCLNNGSWSGTQPICGINIARRRNVSYQSQFVDEEKRENGQVILDGFFSSCSIAKKADLVPSVWTVDLLEEQSFAFVKIAVGAGDTDTLFEVYYGNSSDSRDAVPLGEDSGPNIDSQVLVEFELVPMEIIVYELRLQMPVIGRFVTVKVWPQKTRYKLALCEVAIYSTKAPHADQCRLSLFDDNVSLAVHDTKCFSFHGKEKLEWNDARKRCGSLNASLVTGVTTQSQEFLRITLSFYFDSSNVENVFWVGGHRRQDFIEEGITPIMRWLNDTTKKYFKWTDSLTDGNEVLESCLAIAGPLDWSYTFKNCLTSYPWICQYDIPSCGSPEQQPLTSLEESNRQVGDSTVYSCPEGYVIIGTKIRTCLSTGQWSDSSPSCKYVNCGPPEQIDNATIVLLQGTTTYGSAVEYTCTSDSLQLVGPRSRVCQRDGKWSGDTPICSEGVPDPQRHTALLGWEVLLGIALGCMSLLLIVTVITFVIIYTKKQSGAHYVRELERKNMLARFDSDDSIPTSSFTNSRNSKTTGLIYAYDNGKANGKV